MTRYATIVATARYVLVAVLQLLTSVASYADRVCKKSCLLVLLVVQQEMTQVGRGSVRRLNALATRYARPVHQKVLQLLRQGYQEGEFRRVAPDFVYSMSAIIVSYFTSSSFIQVVSGRDPLTTARIAQRRKSVVGMISAALFTTTPENDAKRKERRK